MKTPEILPCKLIKSRIISTCGECDWLDDGACVDYFLDGPIPKNCPRDLPDWSGQVLSDDEINTILDNPNVWERIRGARAIEAAVIAKMIRP